MSLLEYMGLEILNKFKIYYDRLSIMAGNHHSVELYHGHISSSDESGGINVVIIEAIREQKDGKHTDLYFRTFQGPRYSEDSLKLQKEINITIARKNRIAAKYLKKKLQELIKK